MAATSAIGWPAMRRSPADDRTTGLISRLKSTEVMGERDRRAGPLA